MGNSSFAIFFDPVDLSDLCELNHRDHGRIHNGICVGSRQRLIEGTIRKHIERVRDPQGVSVCRIIGRVFGKQPSLVAKKGPFELRSAGPGVFRIVIHIAERGQHWNPVRPRLAGRRIGLAGTDGNSMKPQPCAHRAGHFDEIASGYSTHDFQLKGNRFFKPMCLSRGPIGNEGVRKQD